MDFELTDDQHELQQVVREIMSRECPATYLRAVIAGDDDGSSLWKSHVQLDWPSLTVPEVDGGIGLGAVELGLVLEELGAVADPTPFLATSSQYLPLVRECGDAAQRTVLLGALCGGSSGASAYATDSVSAAPAGNGLLLRGTAHHVVDGDRADHVALVVASEGGPAVVVVAQDDVRSLRMTTFDPSLHIAQVDVNGVRVPEEQVLRATTAAAIARARQEAVIGLAAMMVGACRRVLDLALTHVRERRQFGAPIGSFQAVKHMAVDVYVAMQRARVLHQFAALAIAEDDPRRALAASMAKAAAGDSQRIAGRHGIQLFGGLGFTWENDVHLYVRRAKVGELLFGTSADHNAYVGRSTFDTLRGTA